MTRPARIWLKALAWAGCLLPLLVLVYYATTDGLGANPISFITTWLGQWTFRLLLVALALTPLRIVFGIGWPLLLRRLLGLFAFFYASLHFLVWILIDHYFNWDQMLADLVKRRYITVGMLALLLLVPLAITSTNGMVKRLGGTMWRRLHRLVYVVGGLAALHFLWLAKKGRTGPYVYAAILALLLGVRLWGVLRRRLRRSAEPAGARTAPA